MEKKPIITQRFFCIKSNHMNNLLFLIISIDIFVHLPYYTTPAKELSISTHLKISIMLHYLALKKNDLTSPL